MVPPCGQNIKCANHTGAKCTLGWENLGKCEVACWIGALYKMEEKEFYLHWVHVDNNTQALETYLTVYTYLVKWLDVNQSKQRKYTDQPAFPHKFRLLLGLFYYLLNIIWMPQPYLCIAAIHVHPFIETSDVDQKFKRISLTPCGIHAITDYDMTAPRLKSHVWLFRLLAK